MSRASRFGTNARVTNWWRPITARVTHEMRFAREISDRVCFIGGGQIREVGPPEALFTAPKEKCTRDFLKAVLADN